MTAILGISAFYHDSAAAIVCDGEIIAAAQEERFTRKKHDHRFPKHAVAYCLEMAGIKAEKLDAVAFYDKPLLKFERLLQTYLAHAPLGFASFLKALPLWLRQKLFLPREIDRGLDGEYEGPIYFTGHHEAHAASAFYPSPFEDAAVITLDGVGEWATTSWGVGNGNRLELEQEIRFPHSLGLLYSAVTSYLGFRVNSGEYKVMGLAPYGQPKYVSLLRENVIDVKDDGSFWLDPKYFKYSYGLTMTTRHFHKLLGGPPRKADTRITQREMDIARSVQVVVEEVIQKIATFVHSQTGSKNLCLAGGVALNCVSNGRLLRESPFDEMWVQPAAGDAGGALGAALVVWHKILDKVRVPAVGDSQRGSLLGPAYSNEQVASFLDATSADYEIITDEKTLCAKVADLLASGKVVGHLHGRAEFGPRALGNRSILGDPRSTDMQTRMNLKIKFRESFRPFAPSVLAERAEQYFDLQGESPYMLIVAPVRRERRTEMTPEQNELFGIDMLKVPRSDIPAVTHVDYSARVQTVDEKRNRRYYGIISAFEELTGCAAVVNTSFNIRGEPIVLTPEDAYKCFMFTHMDALVMENCICLRERQPRMPGAEEYRNQFELD